MTRGPAAAFQRAGVVSALVTVSVSFDNEPTGNSQDELAVATPPKPAATLRSTSATPAPLVEKRVAHS